MQLELMSASELFLTDLLTTNRKTRINGFRIGTTPGFTPSKGGVGVSGSNLYSGTADQIRYTIVSQHEITFSIFIDHEVGDFSVGNLMIFLNPKTGTSNPVPFLWMSLNAATHKNKSDLPAYIVGNKIIIHATVWFPYLTQALDLSQHEEYYVKLKNLPNEKYLPDIDLAEYDQYIIDTHTNFDALALTVKDNIHGRWWSMAYTQFEDDPYLGHIQGGIAGNGYGNPSTIKYYDGKHYKLNNDAFDLVDGGANWIAATEAPVSGETY